MSQSNRSAKWLLGGFPARTTSSRQPNAPAPETDLFRDWLYQATPAYRWDWPHLEFIRRQLDAVSRGDVRRLMLFVPPRHGKTEIATVRYPVYRLQRDPAIRVVVAAYNQILANKFSRKSRRIATGRVPLSSDRVAVEDWETTEGGGLRAVGVGAGITGQGADLIVIDDPVKSREEAESPAYRERVWDWYKDDLYTRLEPGGSIVLIQTRWNVDDLAGRILSSDDAANWTVVSLPAEAEDNDPLGRAPGDALCPERYDTADLARIKLVLGSASYAALYQQRPTPREGALFKAEWFARRYQDSGDVYSLDGKPRRFAHKECRRFAVVDPAGGTSGGADYTVITVFGVTPENDLLVLWVERDRFPVEQIVPELKLVCRDWKPEYVCIESGFLQSRFAREARKVPGMPAIREVDPGGKSKLARALPAIVRAEAGQVYLPQQSPWLDEFLAELLVFTGQNDAHDDQVDTLSYGVAELERDEGEGVPMVLGRKAQ